jgi:PKD repeat protein
MKKIIAFLMFLSMLVFAEAQNNSCINAQFVCFGNTNMVIYPAGVNVGNAQTGPNYGCMVSQPNPAWFYMLVSNSGNIEIHMQGTGPYDIDFVCWGPFATMQSPSPCINSLTAGSPTPNHHATGPSPNYPSVNMIDCSFDASFEEWCYIPNAITGQFYILMITNFSNLPQNILFSQNGINQPGAGSLSCTPYLTVNISSNTPLCVGDTLKLFAPTYPNAQYSWTGPNNFSSNVQNPQICNITSANAGLYQLTLLDSLQQFHFANLQIQIGSKPVPAFQYSIVNQNVVFSNLTLNSDSSYWRFGDGSSSSLFEPWHDYDTLGMYNVTLYSYNQCGYDSLTIPINISSLGLKETDKSTFVISPNPSKDVFYIDIPDNMKVNAYEVLSSDGQMIMSSKTNPLTNPKLLTVNLSKQARHVYFLKIYTNEKTIFCKLVKN